LLSKTIPFSVRIIESSLVVLVTLPPELFLVNAGRCRGLWFCDPCAAGARYDAGLKDRPAIAVFCCAVAAGSEGERLIMMV
jgi:hypothetical protein